MDGVIESTHYRPWRNRWSDGAPVVVAPVVVGSVCLQVANVKEQVMTVCR
jgi:hypothetical protein